MDIRKRLFASVISLLAVQSTTVLGDSLAYKTKWTHYGVRPLAMGNAFVSVVDDFNALFYNPAGLARIKEWDGEFLNPTLETSKDTPSFLTSLQELSSGDSSSTKEVLKLIKENTGKHHHLGAMWTPHLIFPSIGIGLGIDLDLSLNFHRYPSAFISAGPTVILPISYAMNFLEERLSIGASLKLRAQAGVFHEFSIDDIKALTSSEEGDSALEKFVDQGSATGIDIGMLFTPMKPMSPTLGISISDFGGSSFEPTQESKYGNPQRVLPSVNVGMSLKPIETPSSYLLAAIDMHSINQPFDYSKKLNIGLEWGYGSSIKLQTGLHHGYMTAGLQLDVGLLALRLATYAEELGNVAGTAEDRRYIGQIKLLI